MLTRPHLWGSDGCVQLPAKGKTLQSNKEQRTAEGVVCWAEMHRI